MRQLSNYELRKIFNATISHARKAPAPVRPYLIGDAGHRSAFSAGAPHEVQSDRLTDLVTTLCHDSNLEIRMLRLWAGELMLSPLEGRLEKATMALVIALGLAHASGPPGRFRAIARSEAAVVAGVWLNHIRRALPDEALLLRSASLLAIFDFEKAGRLAEEALRGIVRRGHSQESSFLSSVAQRLAGHAHGATLAVISGGRI